MYLNFHPVLEVVSRYRDPQPQVFEITHIYLILDQTFTNFDVYHFSSQNI